VASDASTAGGSFPARRDRALLLVGATLLTLLAWAALVLGHGDGPAVGHATGPHVHPDGPGGLLLAFTMWLVMMVAMMLPAVLPWILLFSDAGRRHDPLRGTAFSTLLFVGGYFAIWALFSIAAAAVQLLLQRAALLDPTRLALSAGLGGALLIVAGLFQLTPLKAACLRHCRSPLGFLLSSWRPGRLAAFRLGSRHGAYCLGCCWALMVLSFALGVMNLAWMAGLTAFLCIEKIVPGGDRAGRIFGLLCVVWGIALLAG